MDTQIQSALNLRKSRQMNQASPSAPVANTVEAPARKVMVTALGVVFGDIGTSPLYAFRECLDPKHGIAASPENIVGLLSLIVWSMVLIISVTYVGIIMKTDNQGEGGVLALSSLLSSATKNWRLWTPIGALGVIGSALFFGDGFITPPVSILGAMEGLGVAAPGFEQFAVPITLLVLVALFAVQKRGTGAMGKVFGPVMLVWFGVLGVLGLQRIVVTPEVLWALNPWYGVQFFLNNGVAAFVIMSSVFLAVTGGEAIYADMGHFGRAPIRRGWFLLVLPALVCNYFGQGALMLEDPEARRNPFYLLAPTWAVAPLILLATAAAIIASQAVISGVFSLTRQAINMGYLPRLRVVHSSLEEIGQVYVPSINWLLCAGTVILVVTFGSSTALAGAYGIAISSTMLIDAVLVILFLEATRGRAWRRTIVVLGFVAVLDVLFVASNALKIAAGGWMPILVAALLYLLMMTWYEGRRTLNWVISKEQMPERDFLTMIAKTAPNRAPGTAVYFTSEGSGIPRALVNNLRFNQVLHERNILITFVRSDIPIVRSEDRVDVTQLAPAMYRVVGHFGFMETPNLLIALRAAEERGLEYRPDETMYIVGR